MQPGMVRLLSIRLAIASITEDVATPEKVIADVTDGVDSRGVTEIRFPSDQACGADRLNFRSATCWDMIEADVTGPLMRVVPAGDFIMGEDADDSASPAHKQTIAQPFVGVQGKQNHPWIPLKRI